MPKKEKPIVLKKIGSINYQKLNWKTVLFVLCMVALFIRFPFFFRDYIDRDESTFIIMGQSWVDGHLPYTQLWDLKPPIVFLFFALIIKVFGKSFIAIRLIGSLLVALTAFFTYLIAKQMTSKKVAFWAALFCVVFQSMFGSLQGVMSEHICTFFFTVGVFLIFHKKHWGWYLAAGILFGLSVMTKLNMVYPLLTLSLYLLWEGFRTKQVWHSFKNLTLMGIATILVIALNVLPYYLEGIPLLCWQSIIEAPMAYSSGKFHSPLKTLPYILVIFGLFAAGFYTKAIDRNSRDLQLLTAVVIGILLSYVQSGKVNGHYLIQLYPFVLIPFGMALSKLRPIPEKFRIVVIVLLVLLPMETYLEFANIIRNKQEKGTFFNGEGIDVPRYIVDHGLETKNIFFTEYHIGYWVLDESPPTKAATHPSNITREELFPYMQNPRKTGLEELKYIMEVIQPKTLVARKGKKIFDKKLVEYNTYIDSYLEQHYTLVATVDRGLIYQRLK